MARLILISMYCVFLIFLGIATATADALSQEVLQRLKEEGRFDEFLKNAAKARARGINNPSFRAEKSPDKIIASAENPFRVLTILVDYPDRPYTDGYDAGSRLYFERLLFSEQIMPSKSMREYYIENSYGEFHLEGDVVGWYTLPENMTYYTNYCDGSNGWGSDPHNAMTLVEHAIALADPHVDFSEYDNDGDGEVEAVIIVHAGYAYEESGSSCHIHSHQGYTNAWTDGVEIHPYTIQPEESWLNEGLVQIGIFCHEFGHILGLPDLYDYDYSSWGIGDWGLMGVGNYNGNSTRPASLSAWCKQYLGWIEPVQVTENLIGAVLPAASTEPVAYRLWREGMGGSEYFLVENRQKIGFDNYLPGEGLLIWHIDDEVYGNDDDWHPQVFLEPADGEYDLQNDNNQGDIGDPWPRQGLSPEFTDLTEPNSRDYNGLTTQVAVWNISPSDSVITANLDIVWSRPLLTITDTVFSDATFGNSDGFLDAGETIEFSLAFSNIWEAAVNAEISLNIDDPALIIVDGYSTISSIPTGGEAGNHSDPFVFHIPIDYQPRIDSFFVTISANGGTDIIEMTLVQNVGRPTIIIVNDDIDTEIEDFYLQPFRDRRQAFGYWSTNDQGTPLPSLLQEYQNLIWFTGTAQTEALSAADRVALAAFIDNGGNLFLSGQGIAGQLAVDDPDFLTGYLRAEYIDQFFALIPILDETPGGLVSNGLGQIAFNSPGGAGNQTVYDHILPTDSSVGEWQFYDIGQGIDYAAVAWSDQSKVFFYAFGFESIINDDPRFTHREIVLDSILSFWGETIPAIDNPAITALEIGPGDAMHVVTHTPEISWSYSDPADQPQVQFEIEVGVDYDWTIAELWQSGMVVSSDTSAMYIGEPLVDGNSYYLRVRVNNGIDWSSWWIMQFRMNTAPEIPTGLSPNSLAGVGQSQPVLSHENAVDDEGDYLRFDYQVYADIGLTQLVAEQLHATSGPGIHYWMVPIALDDDSQYVWRSRADDGFESGPWSSSASFWVNSVNETPTPVTLHSPDSGVQILSGIPEFVWSRSVAGDLFDTVFYSFYLASEATFASADSMIGLKDTTYTPAAIPSGNQVFWKVAAADLFGGRTESPTFNFYGQIPGDANGDYAANVGDGIFIINFVFKSGPAPLIPAAADVNADCAINVGDAVYLINYIFKSGPAPLIGCAQ